MFENTLSYEESELSESLTNDNSAFRISVSLQRYFDDVRARSYIMVARKGRVRCLEKRIQKIFGLPEGFCLCTNKHLLPSSEPLALLCPGDVIEVVPFHEAHGRSPSVVSVNNGQKHIQSDVSGRESQMQNVDKCSPTATNYQEAKSNETNKNMISVHSEEGSGPSDIVIDDDVNGARLSHSAPQEDNSRTKVDNGNFSSGDKNCSYDTKDANSLRLLKRQALALLDAHRSALEANKDDEDVREASNGRDAVDALDASAYEPPPRRARRRVRRRARRRTSVPEPTAEPEKENYQESEKCPDPAKDLDSEKYQESEKYPELEKDLELEKDMDLRLEPRSELFSETEPYSSINAVSQCQSDSAGVLSPPRARLNDVTRNDAACARPPRLVRALAD